MNTSANSAMVLPSSRNVRPRDGLPARALATRREPMRTSSQKSAQARAAPAPAQIAPARPVTSAARIRLMRSIRASTAVSCLVVLFRSRALVRLRHAHQRLDGGAETEEEAEVHDPVCVELAIQEVAGAAADHQIE